MNGDDMETRDEFLARMQDEAADWSFSITLWLRDNEHTEAERNDMLTWLQAKAYNASRLERMARGVE